WANPAQIHELPWNRASRAVSQSVGKAAAVLHQAVVAAGENRERAAGVDRGAATEPPASQKVRSRTRGQQALASPAGELVRITDHKAVPEVEVTVTPLLGEVMFILQEAVGAACADQVFLHLVDGV